MADVTNLFKATVKTVKARRRALRDDKTPDNILGTKKQKGEFSGKAKVVLSNITELKAFLSKHRKEYINTCNHVSSVTSKMTDAERDQIDVDAQTFMRTCSEAIKLFRQEVERDAVADQVRKHREAVCQLLEVYLKGVCKIYSEQRAVRVKRVVDRKRMFNCKVEPVPKISGIKRPWIFGDQLSRGRLEPEATKAWARTSSSSKERLEEKEEKKDGTESPREEVAGPSSALPPTLLSAYEEDDDLELSADEAQMYEEENQQLFEEMNSIVDEVRQIEGKVVEISRLQEIFSEKVLEQEKDIDRIADTVVGTTENIKVANEEIRQAMKNNAGLRVWILFFLIVCSFSLLFLDWYNT